MPKSSHSLLGGLVCLLAACATSGEADGLRGSDLPGDSSPDTSEFKSSSNPESGSSSSPNTASQKPTINSQHDVVIYGGGSAGVAAVVAAAKRGANVALVHDVSRLGGMMTNGVTRTDVVRRNGVSGFYEDFRKLVSSSYFARGSQAFELSKHQGSYGLEFEPDVAYEAVQSLLSRVSYERIHGYLPDSGAVQMDGDAITSITVRRHDGGVQRLSARIFIDASDAGDVLGQAGIGGVDWRVGRESRSEFGESLAGDFYKDGGGSGSGDDRMQAYNYRFTIQKGGRTNYQVPPDYQSNLAEYRRNRGGFDCAIDGKVYNKMQVQACLPGNKIDINVDKIGVNHDYPTATRERRKAIEKELRDFAIGYLHFVRTELGHPELGLPSDYQENGNFPEHLYVREARRLVGRYVMRQDDVIRDSFRGREFADSIAMGEYGCDSHCVRWTAKGCEGGFWVSTKPYQIPYRAIVPVRITNLLVPHAASATHVAYASVRMEPVRTSLGTAAGVAAVLALGRGGNVAGIDVSGLQAELIERHQALTYFADVPPESYAFEHVQRVAMQGAMQGYDDYTFRPDQVLQRAHAAVALKRAFSVPTRGPSRPSFEDVPSNHWAYSAIESLKAAGVINGHADGTYRPQEVMTRAQLAKTIAMIGDFPPSSGTRRYTDVPTTHWAYGYIEALARRGIAGGYGDGTFHPDEAATRFHVAKFIVETLDALGR